MSIPVTRTSDLYYHPSFEKEVVDHYKCFYLTVAKLDHWNTSLMTHFVTHYYPATDDTRTIYSLGPLFKRRLSIDDIIRIGISFPGIEEKKDLSPILIHSDRIPTVDHLFIIIWQGTNTQI